MTYEWTDANSSMDGFSSLPRHTANQFVPRMGEAVRRHVNTSSGALPFLKVAAAVIPLQT